MIYLKTKKTPSISDKAIFIQNSALPMENGALEGQKTLLYNNVAFSLKDFPENIFPKVGDKCLFIADRNLCIPVYSETPKSTLLNGLVSYWPLNESFDSAIAQDTIGNYPLITEVENNQLQLHGGYLGIFGSAWGSRASSYRWMRSSETISPEEYKNAYTFNIWFLYPNDSTGGNRQLIGINRATNSTDNMKEIGLYANSDGWIHFCPVYWTGSSGSWEGFVSAEHPLDTWGMATGVFENGVAKLYLNGTLVGTKTFESLPNRTGYLTLFGQCWGQTNPVRLDEAGFWNRALNESEVALLYNNGKGGTASNISAGGLLVCVPLDCRKAFGGENGWTLSQSFDGNSFGFQNGIPCISKENSYGAYTLSPASRLPDGATPFTVSFWSKCSTPGGIGTVETINISWGASDAGSGAFYIGASATQFAVVTYSPNSTLPTVVSIDIDGTKWHHYLVRYTETNVELWVDEIKLSGALGRYSITPQLCTISGRYWAVPGAHFSGSMAMLRIYSRAVSYAEIQALAREFTPVY